MINQDRLVRTFLELGLIDGIHGNERDIAQHIMKHLSALGVDSVMDDAGTTFGGNAGNVRARLNGSSTTAPILLCAHMDTIQSTKNLKHVRQNGMIASDGTTILGGDDRSGPSLLLEAILPPDTAMCLTARPRPDTTSLKRPRPSHLPQPYAAVQLMPRFHLKKESMRLK
ncbi:MAG: hypothetical protein NTV54_01620 [Ignavibacteriales bacterium]|nr:hypothetical protein [Ignavibacteriales bacterium]